MVGREIITVARPRPGQPRSLVAMDRTTLTANLKPLARRGRVTVAIDDRDKRTRRLAETSAGRALLAAAVPVWAETHAAIERGLAGGDPDRLRAERRALS